MQIRDLMSKPVMTCRSDDTLNAAARLMWEHDCGAIPVTSADGKLVGMVTDRDICMATHTKGKPPQEIAVSEVMAKKVVVCGAHDSLELAWRLMSDHQVRRLAVVDRDHRPVGLLSLNDLARHAASARKKDGLEREVTSTLAAVCRPRARGAKAAVPATAIVQSAAAT